MMNDSTRVGESMWISLRLLVVQDEIARFIHGKPSTIRTIKCASVEHTLDREQGARREGIMAKPCAANNEAC